MLFRVSVNSRIPTILIVVCGHSDIGQLINQIQNLRQRPRSPWTYVMARPRAYVTINIWILIRPPLLSYSIWVGPCFFVITSCQLDVNATNLIVTFTFTLTSSSSTFSLIDLGRKRPKQSQWALPNFKVSPTTYLNS